MQKNIFEILRTKPKLGKIDFFLILIPTVLWLIGVYSRQSVMTLSCITEPGRCIPENVFQLDRPATELQSHKADRMSFVTQDLSGYSALFGPVGWASFLAVTGRLSPGGALIAAGTDLTLIFQSIVWNGAATEAGRLIVQRPRPFVYSNPLVLGADPANYTSFFSGHTSFTAAAGTAFILSLVRRQAPRLILILSGSVVSVLVFLTGLFRVLSGRHFPTDVLFAAIVGTLVAFLIAFLHQNRIKSK